MSSETGQGCPSSGPRDLFNLPVSALTMQDTVLTCHRALLSGESVLIGVVNAAKVVNQRRDPELRRALLSCDVLVADGQSVVWASKVLRQPLPERVAGIDLFEALLAVAAEEGHSVYLLGGTQQVLDTLVAKLRASKPGLRIAGARHGYFSEEDVPEICEEIRTARPSLLFLGMPSPLKERFEATYGRNLGVSVVHGVGGSFDVMAGLVRRAPLAWQRLGLEWAYRLAQEPARLWRRYALTNSTFVYLTVRELRLRPKRAIPASG